MLHDWAGRILEDRVYILLMVSECLFQSANLGKVRLPCSSRVTIQGLGRGLAYNSYSTGRESNLLFSGVADTCE